ncbi:MAG: F0F1 ATP synthase subunit delta [Opitutae bacterium]
MFSRYKALVRALVKSSANEHGIIELSLVQEVLAGLRECKPTGHRQILNAYLFEIRKTLRQQLVEVEFGSQPNELLISSLKSKLDRFNSHSFDLQVSQNDQLIAGYRIRLVDDVFEDSIKSRLSKLSQSLTS